MFIIKAGHGHRGICFTIFFSFVIENFHSKKVILSKMVLFLGFLNNVTNEIQIKKNVFDKIVLDKIRTVLQIREGMNPIETKLLSKGCEQNPKRHAGTFCPKPIPK